MSEKGIYVSYGDFALGAKENFVPTSQYKAEFVNLSQLQQTNLVFPKYANPCELYQTVLDNSALPLPEDMQNLNLGFWSSTCSDKSGEFGVSPVIVFNANGQYTSPGFTFTFDKENGIFCTHMTIEWYRNGARVSTQDFYPDNAFYFAEKKVENFDKVIMKFHKLNMPNNRLKLHVIDWGYGTQFHGDELRNVSISQEIDPISSQITINTCNLTINSKRSIEYSFQQKQPLSIFVDGRLIMTSFIKNSTRKGINLWTVQAEDYISILDGNTFIGDIYDEKNVGELLGEIFGAARVPYEVDEEIASQTVSGHIPYTSCRHALMLVAFATTAVIDTNYSDVVKVKKLDNEIKQVIPRARIKQGQNFEQGEIVTSVQLTVHNYIKPKKNATSEDVYDAEKSGTGDNILVTFSEPLYGLEIEDGEILSSSANHAVINAGSNCILSGKKYKDNPQIISQSNDVVLTTDLKNTISINDATLVSSANAETVLENAAEWLMKNNAVNLEIIEGKHVTGGGYVLYGNAKYGVHKYNGTMPTIVTYDQPVYVGDKITSQTEYMGDITGRIIKQNFSLSGNVVVKKAVLK